jgi:membrane fusion protein (multidrug efflux system)
MADKPNHRKLAMTLLTALFVFAGIVWLLYWLIWGRFEIYTDDAYVNGNIVQLMSQIPGSVIEINTDDTLLVTQGEPIIRLDPSDTDIALQRSQATLADTVRKVRQYFENVKSAQATVTLRHADLIKAQLDVQRRIGLVGKRAVSREEMQHYITAEKAASARYQTALHNLNSALAIVDNSDVYTHPLVERAKANLKTAYLNSQRTTILAPATGYVAKRSVQVGQRISINTSMLAIIPLNEVWVDANYKESQLDRIRIGQPVTLYADAYPDMTFHGKILGLSPGTGVSFALLPPQNATGNWIKIVQRVPVRIQLDLSELKKYPLLIGLSMRVTTHTYQMNGPRLTTISNRKQLYSTNVFNNQIKDANELIDTILKDNSPNLSLPRMPVTSSLRVQRSDLAVHSLQSPRLLRCARNDGVGALNDGGGARNDDVMKFFEGLT